MVDRLIPPAWRQECKQDFVRTVASTLAALFVAALICWIFFGTLYWWAEEYRYIEALHHSMQTITTVGYGDKAPQTDWGMIISMMMQPVTVVVMLLVGANLVGRAVKDPKEWTHREQQVVKGAVLIWLADHLEKKYGRPFTLEEAANYAHDRADGADDETTVTYAHMENA